MSKSQILSLFHIYILLFIVKAQDLQPDSYKIIVGDFNGDQKDDYIKQKVGPWAQQGDSLVEVFLSLGDNNFQNFVLTDGFDSRTSNFNLFVGDFNGDGYDDILKQEKGGQLTGEAMTVYLLLADGAGNFVLNELPESFQLNGDLANIYVGDFNGDGKDDIFRQAKGLFQGSDSNAWASWILFSVDEPEFFSVVYLPLELELNGDKTNLYVGDFNGDGRDDIFRQEKSSFAADGVNTANLLLSNLNNSFDKIVLSEDYSLNGDFTALYVGDFNGDGLDDILRREKGEWAIDDSNSAQLLLSDGMGTFESITLSEGFNLKADNSNVYVGDFNADGKADFLRQITEEIALSVSAPNDIFMSVGENFDKFGFGGSQEDTVDVVTTFYVGDFDGDTRADLLRCTGINDIQIYYSNGDGTFL